MKIDNAALGVRALGPPTMRKKPLFYSTIYGYVVLLIELRFPDNSLQC